MLLIWSCIERAWPVLTLGYLTYICFEGDIATPDACWITVYQSETRWRANSHYFCFSVQHELIAVHQWLFLLHLLNFRFFWILFSTKFWWYIHHKPECHAKCVWGGEGGLFSVSRSQWRLLYQNMTVSTISFELMIVLQLRDINKCPVKILDFVVFTAVIQNFSYCSFIQCPTSRLWRLRHFWCMLGYFAVSIIYWTRMDYRIYL